MPLRTLVFVCFTVISAPGLAAMVDYEFTIDNKTVNITGDPVSALAINDQIPAPVIRAAVGDTLRVTFHNELDELSTVHWHGILLPPDQDGVAYLNTRPIEPGGSHTFEFPITHAGTFWYHSHTDLQIQKGLYGSVVLTDPENPQNLQDEVVVFSDWTDEPVANVLNNLKSDDNFYSFEKETLQTWDKVLANGGAAVRNRLNGAFTRMGPMDLTDVHYDNFLVNGATINSLNVEDASATQMRLRLINGSTSSYFDVEYAGGPMTIIAADGQDVVPINVLRLRMATAETYDVLVPLESASAFELHATSVDGTGYSSLFVGSGTRVTAPGLPPPNLYLMDHANMEISEMSGMNDMNHAMHNDMQVTQETHGATHTEHNETMPALDVIPHMTNYENLMALKPSSLDANQQWREIALTLTGSMERYVWSFDGQTLRENPQILIRKGENVRMQLTNETMMNHPLHLHGHFFRVVNQHGERSPLKHTVNIPPMGQVIIEFDANEDQDWLFHCHNQYHMKSGMNRVISYEESSIFTPEIARQIVPSQRWFDIQEFHLMSAFADYEYSIFDERHEFRFEADFDMVETYEVHLMYNYHFNRFVSGFVGMEGREHHHGKNHDITIAGVNVLLPFMIDSEWRVDDHGDFRLELQSELPLTRHVGLDWRWNTDNEYRYGINFKLNNRWAVTVHTDTEYGDGIGVKFFY